MSILGRQTSQPRTAPERVVTVTKRAHNLAPAHMPKPVSAADRERRKRARQAKRGKR